MAQQNGSALRTVVGLEQQADPRPHKTLKDLYSGNAAGFQPFSAKQRFNALRDMTDGDHFIPESALKRIKALGEGAYAAVEVCEYTAPGRKPQKVAVKRLKASSNPGSHDEAKAFANEASILRHLQHRHIVGYIGYGHDEPRPTDSETEEPSPSCTYLVQEYLEAGTLKATVLNQMVNPMRSSYSTSQGCRWMRQVAEALVYLHSRDPAVIHRDLKPDNILLRPKNGSKETDAVITDFGLHTVINNGASVAHEQLRAYASGQPITDSSLLDRSTKLDKVLQRNDSDSQHGARLYDVINSSRRAGNAYAKHGPSFDLTGRTGSYLYMAPEVLLGQNYNEKADVFSFGVILYEVVAREVTSAVVIQSGDPQAPELYAHKVAGGYRRPVADLPEPLQQLISQCWAGEPSARPSIDTVAARLGELAQLGTIQQHKASKGGGCRCM